VHGLAHLLEFRVDVVHHVVPLQLLEQQFVQLEEFVLILYLFLLVLFGFGLLKVLKGPSSDVCLIQLG